MIARPRERRLRAHGLTATVIAPFHYHSLAVPGGTATQAGFLTDRQVCFALGAALGCLSRSPALPAKDYRRHMAALPFAASLFESRNPKLLPPLTKRLNLDDEGGLDINVQNATYTGNLKTFFAVQEVTPGVAFEGAVFGDDPFELAAAAEGRPVSDIVVRTGRHLGGMLLFQRAAIGTVRLNAHTAATFGAPMSKGMDVYVLHDLQATVRVSLDEAADIVGGWNREGWGRA